MIVSNVSKLRERKEEEEKELFLFGRDSFDDESLSLLHIFFFLLFFSLSLSLSLSLINSSFFHSRKRKKEEFLKVCLAQAYLDHKKHFFMKGFPHQLPSLLPLFTWIQNFILMREMMWDERERKREKERKGEKREKKEWSRKKVNWVLAFHFHSKSSFFILSNFLSLSFFFLLLLLSFSPPSLQQYLHFLKFDQNLNVIVFLFEGERERKKIDGKRKEEIERRRKMKRRRRKKKKKVESVNQNCHFSKGYNSNWWFNSFNWLAIWFYFFPLSLF